MPSEEFFQDSFVYRQHDAILEKSHYRYIESQIVVKKDWKINEAWETESGKIFGAAIKKAK